MHGKSPSTETYHGSSREYKGGFIPLTARSYNSANQWRRGQLDTQLIIVGVSGNFASIGRLHVEQSVNRSRDANPSPPAEEESPFFVGVGTRGVAILLKLVRLARRPEVAWDDR